MNIPLIIFIGLFLDTFSMLCIIGQIVGFSDRPGLPIGPVFYLTGFLVMIVERQVPVYLSILVFLCCLLFFLFVIFSGVMTYNFIKTFRSFRATAKWMLNSDLTNELNPINMFRQAVYHLTENGKLEHEGFVYLRGLEAPFNYTIVHLLPSGNFEIQITQPDPGYIREGYFVKGLSSNDFPIDNWKIGRCKHLIIPLEDQERIPTFLDLLYSKLYDQGNNYKITAEVFLLK